MSVNKILISSSLVLTGSGLSIYVCGKQINKLLKGHQYNFYIDNINQQIKESKNIIKYMILYNFCRYIDKNYILNNNFINNSLGIIKYFSTHYIRWYYPLMLIIINQYYNNYISILFFNTINKNKTHKYLLISGFILTGVGFFI